jgi:hypothetical protein
MMSLMTYLSFGLEVLGPLYFVDRLWRSDVDSRAAWGLTLATGISFLAVFLVVGRWELAGGALRYPLYAAYALAMVGAWVRVADRPLLVDGRTGTAWGAWGDLAVLLGLGGWALVGLWPHRAPVDLQFPLRGERYHVTHGGSTYPLNYHGLFAASQRYALDLTQRNAWGVRATGLYPGRLSAYEIYGDPVYSPLDGTVVAAVDRFEDLTPGRRRPEHPGGNHVWIRRDSLYVLLAHLKGGSVRVQPGDRVAAGERVAAVGNTGNTSEPHLHVHAVTVDRAPPVPDSALHDGTPVPLRFDGRFLTRNDLVSRPRRTDAPVAGAPPSTE